MTPPTDFLLHPRPSTPPPSPPRARTGPLQVFNPHAAGIDLGEAEHWVAVPPDRVPQPVRRFGTFTVDLDAIADWLIDCGITTVAMASTGVSWIPLFDLLEARGVQVLLIDPRQATRAPGRPKTDRSIGSGCNACTPTGCSLAPFGPRPRGACSAAPCATARCCAPTAPTLCSTCPRPCNRCTAHFPRPSVTVQAPLAWPSSQPSSLANAIL